MQQPPTNLKVVATAGVKAVAAVVATATAGPMGDLKAEATPEKVAKHAQTCVAKAATNPEVTTEAMKAVWMAAHLAPIARPKAVVDAAEAIVRRATTRLQQHLQPRQSARLKATLCRPTA